MAERLGEALLDLRTNDAAFNAGIAQAKGRAQELGQTLDKTKGSSTQLAAEMVTTGRSAAQMGQGFERAGQQVTASAGAQRQGMQQLSFQLGDIATMYSLGARPAQIFASQIGQVTQAVQLMSGGTSRFAAFLGGPWGIALTAATIVLAPFIGKLFEGEDALNAVSFASDNLGDAQSRLRSVIDTTTGALNRQKIELIELARAQALAEIGRSRQAEQQLRGELQGAANQSQVVRDPITGLPILRPIGAGGIMRRRTDSAQVVQGVLDGTVRPEDGTRRLSELRASGRLSESEEIRLASAIGSLGVEVVNRRRAKAELRFYNGNATAADRKLLGVDEMIASPRARSDTTRTSTGVRQRSAAEQQEDFAGRSFDIERQQLQARLALATSAQDRADLQRDLLGLEREQQIAQIETLDLSRAQKDALIAQVEALLGRAPQYDEQGNLIVSANRGLEGEIIARELAVRQLQQSQQMADVKFQGETEVLRNALALADTEAERKAVSLRLLEAEEEFERIRLQTIIDAAARGEAETEAAELARAQLANLNANAAGRREATARQNETEAERYVRNLNATPGQINEAIDGIKIDGLESLNDGLTRAIMGAESLGDVFSRVADQIIADLLRIAIQQAVIRPLANLLFGGEAGGGGGGGLLGSLFAGFFATGGTIPTGQFGIVGEEGPEIAFAGPGGLGILSNPDSRKLMGGAGGGVSVPINISVDATGADQAAIARLNARIDQLSAELPGTIVTTVREARDRRYL